MRRLVAVLGLVLGCQGSGASIGDASRAVDAMHDAAGDASDAAVDARADAPADAAPDAMADAMVDAMVDAAPDAMVDAAPDAVADAAPDAMIDGGTSGGCTRRAEICAAGSPWCLITPLPTTAQLVQVYAVKNTDRAFAFDRTGAVFTWDGCDWLPMAGSADGSSQARPVSESGPDNVWFGRGVRWNGTTLIGIPVGNVVWAFSVNVGWSGCHRWDGANWWDYSCAPTAIGGALDNDVWLGGANGALWRWNGLLLSAVSSPTGATFTAIYAFATNDVWFHANGWFRWNGTSFQAEADLVPPNSDFWDGDRHWNGSAWEQMPAHSPPASFQTTTKGWALRSGGQIEAYSGTSTQPVWTLWNVAGNQLSASSRSNIVARPSTSTPGPNAIELFDGTQWTQAMMTIPFAANTPTGAMQLFTAGGGDVWAMGSQDPVNAPVGYLAHYVGGTTTVLRMGAGLATQLWDIKGSSPNDVWIAVGNEVLHWNGSSLTLGLAARASALWIPGPGKVWALTGSTVQMFDGTAWTSMPGPNGGAQSMWGSSPTDVWAVNGTAIAHFDGSSWLFPPHQNLTSARYVTGFAANDVFFIGPEVVHFDGTFFVDYGNTVGDIAGSTQVDLLGVDPANRDFWVRGEIGAYRFHLP